MTLVWFHGGGNEVGTGSPHDGSALVRNGVIVVAVNYRLGSLGTNQDEARLAVGFEFDATGAPWPHRATRTRSPASSATRSRAGGAAISPVRLSNSRPRLFRRLHRCRLFLHLAAERPAARATPPPTPSSSTTRRVGPVAPARSVPAARAADTTKLPLLWPNLPGSNGAVRPAFNAPERSLATEMQLAWTSFAKNGDPDGPGATAWSPFSILGDQFRAFTPGVVGTSPGFTADHKCGFWEPLEIARALLP